MNKVMKCTNCKYCNRNSEVVYTCRKNPPMIFYDGDMCTGLETSTGWPKVSANDFCGDFEQKTIEAKPERFERDILNQITDIRTGEA